MIHAVDSSVGVELIPNGVDTDRFQPSASTQEDGSLRLLCVARLIERKGQRFLIDAVKKLVENDFDVQLDLIGTGDSEADYQALVKKLDLSDRIRFLGYIPRDQIPQYYSNAQIFILPSYNEGMSVATLEALASGLPVVVTRAGGMDELVDEGVNGVFFDWADTEELVSHLEWLVKHPERRRQMSQASRELAKRFSWDEVANSYYGKFQKLLTSDI
jgi:glycosyltransferase involved in cell wall biosynthesis